MSGTVEYFDSTTTTYHPVDSAEWTTTTMLAHVEVTTSVLPIGDVVGDVLTDDSAVTVANLVTPKADDFNFTNLFNDGTPRRHPSVLTPLTSLWTLFPLAFMTAFLGVWLFRMKYWYYYSRVMVALGLESEFKPSSDDRVPTEVSSARLIRATKSQLNIAGTDELGEVRSPVNSATPSETFRAEDDYVTVRL